MALRFPRWRLSRLLTLLFIAIVFLSVVPIALINARETADVLRERGRERLLHVAQATAASLDQRFRDLLRWGHDVSKRPLLRSWMERGFPADVRDVYEQVALEPVRRQHQLEGVALLALDGRRLLSAGRIALPRPVADWPDFQRAAAGEDVVSDVLRDPATGMRRVFLLVPVRDGDEGPIVGAVVLADDLAALRERVLADSDAEGPDSYGMLADEHLVRLIHSTHPDLEGIPASPLDPEDFARLADQGRIALGPAEASAAPELRAAVEAMDAAGHSHALVEHHQASTGARGQGVLVRLQTMPWLYYVGAPDAYFLAPAQTQMRRAAVSVLLLTALGVALAALLSRWVTRPLRDVAAAASAWGTPRSGARAEPSGPREVAALREPRDALAARVAVHARLLEQQVEERAAQLRETSAELEMFSTSVSRDLPGPLRTVLGMTALLGEQERDRLSQTGREYLGRITGAAARMNQIIDDLATLSRVQRDALQLAPVDVARVASEILDSLRESDPGRRVEVSTAGDLTALADERLVRVAVDNLLRNAWKFTRGRAITRIEIGALDRDGHREFFVRDNGAGFEMERADQLFEPDRRLHGAREFPCAGLGLATVRRVVERHGGHIRAEAEPDCGATFWFTLGAA